MGFSAPQGRGGACPTSVTSQRVSKPDPTSGLRGSDLSPWGWIGGFLRGLEMAAMAAAALAIGALAVERYQSSLVPDQVIPGVRLGGTAVGGLDPEAVSARARALDQARMNRTLTLRAGEATIEASPRELGAVARSEDAAAEALAVGRDGDLLDNLQARVAARRGRIDIPLGFGFDQAQAIDQLREWALTVERPSLPTRLDLARRKVLPAERGTLLLPYDSLSSLALGLAAGAQRIELATQTKAAVADPLASIADDLDISVVLGSFKTAYSATPDLADRKHNLDVGAAAIDGTVLRPGEEFSFNAVVGDRSAEAGYRYAPGITAGEMIDVLGGGICQVSSTLYGAAFFAGLDLVDARPHSRPSSYVDMGLDSTVVYPQIDLKLRNPFDFPVVLHMTVRQGQVHAEVLGPRRPYRVAFERDIVSAVAHETIWRDAPDLRVGHEDVMQRGKRGFVIQRRRVLYDGSEVVREEQWKLEYPPTTEIRRRGSGAAGRIPDAAPKVPLRDPAPHLRILQ